MTLLTGCWWCDAATRLSDSTLERRDRNGQDKYFESLPLSKWALLIIVWHQLSPKKPLCHWLREIVIILGQNYVLL
jgi:hypothetical protein